MIRRDFLKYVGLLGATASLPVVAKGTPFQRNLHEDGVLFNKSDITIHAEEGSLTWEECDHYSWITDRGSLTAIRLDDRAIYFSLDALVKIARPHNFYGKIGSSERINISIALPDTRYMIQSCQWSCMQNYANAGYFHLEGRADSIFVRKTA